MEDNKDNKIILKDPGFPGVDMSVVDLSMISAVKRRWTRLTSVMQKKGTQTFITTKDQLGEGDIIQMGRFGILYRVLKLVRISDKYFYLYKIRRFDGHNTTDVDIKATRLGSKVLVTNRKTFDDLFNWKCEMKEERPIEKTVCEDEPLPCESCEDFKTRIENQK